MEITEERFNTEFVDRKIETQPYLDSTTRGALTAWFEANDSIEPVFVDREEWEKRKEEGTILGEELDEDDDKRRLYLAEDLNIFEMIDVVSAVDKDTFKDNPELATQGVEKIQKLAETFKKAGVYIDQSISYVDKGRDIAEELSKKFFNYGLSLESKTKVEGEAIPPTVLSESEKRELDKWLIGKELYHKIMDRLGPSPSQEDIDRQRRKYFRGYFQALSARKSIALAERIQKATERGIESKLDEPDIEMYKVAFRRGEERLKEKMKIPLTTKNLLKEIGDFVDRDLTKKYQKLYKYLEIPRLREDLAEVRSRGNIEEISEKEFEIAKWVREEINKYQYDDDAHNPSEIIKDDYLNCLGSTLLGTSLLDEVGIKYLFVSPPGHAMTFLVTSDRKLYWQDFTPGYDPRDGMEVVGSMFKANPDILKLAENFDSFNIVSKFDSTYFNVSSSTDAKISALMNNLGGTLNELERYKEAIEVYRKGIELNPNDSVPYNGLGNAFYRLRRYKEAIEVYRKGIELNPDDSDLYNNLGNAFCKLRRYEEAIEVYRKGIELNPNNPLLLFNLSDALDQVGRYDQANEMVGKAINIIKLKNN